MKQITIAGRVGKDGVLRRTQADETVLGFSVAVNDGYGENKSTLWFDCSVWGKRAQSLETHIKKGDPITVSGEFGKREYEGKTQFTVRVNELELQGGGEKREAKPQQTSYDRDDPRTTARELDDEIPF